MNFATLDLNLLRVFNAMLSELSTVRAGERLGLSQSAVSAALGRLREMTQDELFVREGNRMVPTARALALGEPVQTALEQLKEAFSSTTVFNPATAEHNIVVSGTDYVSTLLFPRLVNRVRLEAPGLSLQMLDVPAGDMFSAISRERVDLAIERGMDAPEWVLQAPLFQSYVVCLARKGHPVLARHQIAPGERIPLAVYCQIPQVILSTDGSKVGSIDPKLAELGLSRTVAVTVPHFQAIALAVRSSDLLGNAPIGFARFAAGLLDLDLYLTPVHPPVINMCMYWHRRLERDPCHSWLREKAAATMQFDVRYPPQDLTPFRDLP